MIFLPFAAEGTVSRFTCLAAREKMTKINIKMPGQAYSVITSVLKTFARWVSFLGSENVFYTTE